MSGRKLLRRKAVALGLFGVGLGLLYSIFVLVSNPVGCSCGWNLAQIYYGVPVLIGSIIGLSGSLLCLKSQKAGRILLFAGAPVATPLPSMIASSLRQPPIIIVITSPMDLAFFVLLFGAFSLPGLLFLLAGLVTIPKIRHTVKSMLHKISERYYRIPEDLASPAWR